MADIQAERIRAQLQQRKRQLQERVTRVDADMRHENEPLSADSPDQAIQRENEDVLRNIGGAAAVEVAQINAALQRLDAGTYGLCTECGASIEAERLRAVPHAAHCMGCERAAGR